jgi:hypothetical protein
MGMAVARKKAVTGRAAKAPVAREVRAWEDDPLSEGAQPVERPVPRLPKARMKLAFDAPKPPPGLYDPGTPEFRWWTAAEALSRAMAFWQPVLPKGTTWQRGSELTVRLDAGEKLNAFYNRETLTFFHATVKGQTVFSGESPDVLAHECGHAILDAIRPELWNAMSHEVAAFHESFGDISALLAALQLPSVRAQVLVETGGVLNRTSRVSRVAEQLGWAVRQRTPCAADPDCLRNAVNCFFYQPPDKLPIVGPAATLSSEPHNYSRVFTGAFLLTLTGMVLTLSRQPDAEIVRQASLDAARLLVAAVRAAPIAPNYMAQVAAQFVTADQTMFDGKYAAAIDNGFVGKGVLTSTGTAAARAFAAAPAAAAAAAAASGAAAGRFGARRATAALPVVTLSGLDFGLGDRPILCDAPSDGQRLAVAAIADDGGPLAPASSEETARGFLRELLVRATVERPGVEDDDRTHTHALVEEGGALRVVRRLFDAGLPLARGRPVRRPV